MPPSGERPGEAERVAVLYELDLLNGQKLPELDRLTRLAADICGVQTCVLTLYDDRMGLQISVSSGEKIDVARDRTLCNQTLAVNGTLVIPDARADARSAGTYFVAGPPFVRSYAGTPIGPAPGLPVGVLCIAHPDPNHFSASDVARLERVAELVDAFLENRLATVRARRAAAKTDAERTRQLQFDRIFDAIHDGVNVYSADGRIVELNPAAESILGLTREQQLGRAYVDPRWRTTKPDGSVFPVDEYPINRVLLGGQPVRDVEMGVELPTGERRWISINAEAVRNLDTDAIEFALVMFKDVTQQHLADEALSARNATLAEALQIAEKASRAKSDFISVMSHELRTPMNAVLGCAQLLSQSSLTPVQKRTLGVLEDAGKQMLVLLNDLFDLGAFEADKVRLERQPISLVRLIEDAAVIWASDVREKGLELSVMINPALVAPRNVDSTRVLQIIGNLMANAVKFTVKGGISIQAWPVADRNAPGKVEIEVRDSGPGIPADALGRIFSPFEQVDVSTKRRHGGLGVGLHVARQLAIAMGGDITLESQEGEGSRFTVRIDAPLAALPVARGDDADEPPPAEPRIRDVLCVDDNPRNLYVLGAMLTAAGHRVTECGSGEEAVRLLSEKKFDVVLLDMVMPEVDGFDVLYHVRGQNGPNQDTPVIACTANVLPEQVKAYLEAGTTGVLAKPIDIRAMLQAVAAAA